MDAIIRVSKNINASGIINLASFCFNSIRQRQRIDGREIYSLDPKTVLFTINQNLKKENAHTHTHIHTYTHLTMKRITINQTDKSNKAC